MCRDPAVVHRLQNQALAQNATDMIHIVPGYVTYEDVIVTVHELMKTSIQFTMESLNQDWLTLCRFDATASRILMDRSLPPRPLSQGLEQQSLAEGGQEGKRRAKQSILPILLLIFSPKLRDSLRVA